MNYLWTTLGIALAPLFFAASSAQARSQSFIYQLDSQQGYGTYEQMRQAAETLAQNATHQAFADRATIAVNISVTGHHSGQILPILILRVDRQDWERQPNVNRWAIVPGGIKQLLGFVPMNVSNRPALIVNNLPNPIRDNLTEREVNFYK